MRTARVGQELLQDEPVETVQQMVGFDRHQGHPFVGIGQDVDEVMEVAEIANGPGHHASLTQIAMHVISTIQDRHPGTLEQGLGEHETRAAVEAGGVRSQR